MTVEGDNIPNTVRTRLQFTPSPHLNEIMKRFLRPEARDELVQRKRPLWLFSVQHVNLRLEQGTDLLDEDVVADDKYEEHIAKSHKYGFRLASYAHYEKHDAGIELRLRLALEPSSRERQRLVQPPLFEPGYNGDVELYRLIPNEKLLGGLAVNNALAVLKQHVGADKPDEASVAPWEMYVTNAQLYHRTKLLTLPLKQVEDSSTNHLDTI